MKNGDTYSFTYSDSGMRTSKTVNGQTTYYYLDGDRIIAEQNSNYTIAYTYGADGTPIGMQFRNSSYAVGDWDAFWYEKNLQGEQVKTIEYRFYAAKSAEYD